MNILQKNLRAAASRLASYLPVWPTTMRLSDKIILVDVGASKGIQRKWYRYRHSLSPILFEPNEAEAALLRNRLQKFENSVVIGSGLSDKTGIYKLNIGRSYGCSSIFQANMAFLKDYPISQWFVSETSTEVTCARYDELVDTGVAIAPDIIKIDVEGYESEVLDGFGNLLHDVLGVETEAWLYHGYQNQTLLHDLIKKLSVYELRLRRIEEVPGFDGDLVCVNAYFTMPRKRYLTLSPLARAKFDLMSRVWKLKGYKA